MGEFATSVGKFTVHFISTAYVFAGWAITAAVVFYVLWGIVRAGDFIADAIYGPIDTNAVDISTRNKASVWERFLRAWNRMTNCVHWLTNLFGGIGRTLWFYRRAPQLLVAPHASLFLAARYYVELEILCPREEKPNKSNYTSETYRKKIREWLEGESKRKKNVISLFQEKLSTSPDFKVFVILELFKKIGFTGKRPAKITVRPVNIEDFPKLDDSRTGIKRYFDALNSRSHTEPEKAKRFLLEVETEVGYLAPLFLITGLINRFGEEEGWKRILDNYRRLIRGENAYSEELRELRSFMFNCWLLWGPSIAPCSCSQWTTTKNPSVRSDLMIQYGYGDENNSLDILIKNGQQGSFRRELMARLESKSKLPENGTAVLAAPFKVKGRFRWGQAMADEIAPAQLLICGGSNESKREPEGGRIVLEWEYNEANEKAEAEDNFGGGGVNAVPTATENGADSNATDHSSRYYSAYLWIMFKIHDQYGKPFFDRKWKDLLVFFEHGNIADASTYHMLKEQLVTKALCTLAKILTDTEVIPPSASAKKTRELYISYACALDDSYCGKEHGILFSPCSNLSIIGILREQIETMPEGAQRKVLLERLVIPKADTTRPTEDNPYSSCHLPEIVEEFYADLGCDEDMDAGDAVRGEVEDTEPGTDGSTLLPPPDSPATQPHVAQL